MKYRTSDLRKQLIEFYQKTIDLEDPDRQYIDFLADYSIDLVRRNDKRMPLTQAELASYLGVSRQTVNNWMQRPETIRLGYLLKILTLEKEQ